MISELPLKANFLQMLCISWPPLNYNLIADFPESVEQLRLYAPPPKFKYFSSLAEGRAQPCSYLTSHLPPCDVDHVAQHHENSSASFCSLPSI
ncbi:hypothetical protein KIN20_013066, partial [Parelaphostrongylus tenuis]